jgi:hypothetical protein
MKLARQIFEDRYRAAWIAQNRIDCKINKEVLDPDAPPPRSKHVSDAINKKNGKLGGRPRVGVTAKMTATAETVNRMLKKGMSVEDVAEVLNKPAIRVQDMVYRYGLPREDS